MSQPKELILQRCGNRNKEMRHVRFQRRAQLTPLRSCAQRAGRLDNVSCGRTIPKQHQSPVAITCDQLHIQRDKNRCLAKKPCFQCVRAGTQCRRVKMRNLAFQRIIPSCEIPGPSRNSAIKSECLRPNVCFQTDHPNETNPNRPSHRRSSCVCDNRATALSSWRIVTLKPSISISCSSTFLFSPWIAASATPSASIAVMVLSLSPKPNAS